METKSMNRRMLVFTLALLIVISLASGVYMLMHFQEIAEPPWMKLRTYMIYEQFFVWNGQSETDYMIWNVTKLGDSVADLCLTSHGVNVTEEEVALTHGEANFTIDTVTREIVNCSDISYIGKKWAFWIGKNVTLGSTVDIFYGVNTISMSESIYVLGQQRECWVVEYNWTTASMRRWYDKPSGVCLKIHVVLYRQDIVIQITETAVLTNIHL